MSSNALYLLKNQTPLFRAWNGKKYANISCTALGLFFDSTFFNAKPIPIDKCKVERCTGIKIKDTEICLFEGDIVKADSMIGLIVYEKCSFWLKIFRTELEAKRYSFSDLEILNIDPTELAVLGNINEHRFLLKEAYDS